MDRSWPWSHPEVVEALAAGRAVVALESTLVAQGLPWPTNLETAIAAEGAVRASGSVPATIAVVGGVARVGLDREELAALAEPGRFRKAGRRDLGVAVALGLDAATTVSATMHIARLAGIGAMATGGLGGVHRGAGATFDVSTDLDELARADGLLLVCSGAKSILDLPATLERLETLGIPIVGYRASTLPGFTAVDSGLPLEWRADTPAEAAAIVRAHRALRLPGAVVLAQSVPDSAAVPGAMMEEALDGAMAEAKARAVSGKPLTPFLLEAVRRATEGRSLGANVALIVANARLAGEVAVALAPGR